jgi:hypothetical protein
MLDIQTSLTGSPTISACGHTTRPCQMSPYKHLPTCTLVLVPMGLPSCGVITSVSYTSQKGSARAILSITHARSRQNHITGKSQKK